jgi:hypothetical protein
MILIAMFSLPLLVSVQGELNEQFDFIWTNRISLFKGSAGCLGIRRMAKSRSEEIPHMHRHFAFVLKELSKATQHVRASMENGTDPFRDVVRLLVEQKSPNDVMNIWIAIGMKWNISHAVEPHKNNSCTSVKNGTLTFPFNQTQYVENVIIQAFIYYSGEACTISFRAFLWFSSAQV